MFTVLRYTLKRFLGQVLGWGIAFGLVTLYVMALYKPMIEQQAELVTLFESYGDTMMAFFGGSVDFLSPGGYMDFTWFSYVPVVAGIFAVLMGSGLLASDEEKGRLDLVMAYPISRAALFWGRFMAFACATLAILGFTWLGYIIGLPLTGWENVSAWALMLPHLSLLTVLLLFGALALLLSLLLPSRTLAASVAGGLMVLSYLVTSLVRVNAQLETLNALLPLRYYQGGWAVNGLEWGNFLALMGVAGLLAGLAWWRFERRDIRVSGEGSWGLPLRPQRTGLRTQPGDE